MSRTALLLALGLILVSGLTLAACQATETAEPEMVEEPTVEEVVEPTVPPPPPTEEPVEEVMMEDLLMVAEADGRFTKLVELVAVAGLTETLQGPGPFTLFAPTDEAFAAVGEEALAELTPEEVAAILAGHVIEGMVMAEDIAAAPEMMVESPTLNEEVMLTVASDGETVMVNDTATVIEADIETSNGVIHVIDTVLLPGEAEEEMPEE